MIITEQEATKKYCVMAGVNPSTGEIFCTASKCMAWRCEIEYERIDGKPECDVEKRGFFRTIKYWLWDVLLCEPVQFDSVYTRKKPTRGYCGLAGRVEN